MRKSRKQQFEFVRSHVLGSLGPIILVSQELVLIESSYKHNRTMRITETTTYLRDSRQANFDGGLVVSLS